MSRFNRTSMQFFGRSKAKSAPVSPVPSGRRLNDISTSWEGEAPAEPQASIDPRQTIRFGGSLTLPSTRITDRVGFFSKVRDKDPPRRGVKNLGEPGAVRPRTGGHVVSLTLVIGILLSGQAIAGSKVDVVVGPKATELERFAASEVAVQFKKLFDAEVKVSEQVPVEAGSLILIGSPTTNPALQPLAATWPKLSDQGHLVRSIKLGDRPALVAGGGSPVATLWAVYELGHHFGIRYALYGDMYPAEPQMLKLEGIDLLLEPTLRSRTWKTSSRALIGRVSWRLSEHEQLIKQLAKLKFNRLVLPFEAWDPYVDFEFKGVKKETGFRLPDTSIAVDGDTAGRTVFRGAKFFENPEFFGKQDYTDRVAAATQQARTIFSTAKKLGMSAGIAIRPLNFPTAFGGILPENVLAKPDSKPPISQRIYLDTEAPRQVDPVVLELAKTQIRAYLQTYPSVEFVSLEVRDAFRSKLHQWDDLSLEQAGLELFSRLVAEKDLGILPDNRTVKFTLDEVRPSGFPILDKTVPAGTEVSFAIEVNARRSAEKCQLMKLAPSKTISCNLILTPPNDMSGVLPVMFCSSWKKLIDESQTDGWSGFELSCREIGDMDFNAYYLSRASFQPELTIKQALFDMLTPTLGEASAERTSKAFEQIEEATTLLENAAMNAVHGSMLRGFYDMKNPKIPESFGKAQELYYSAMNEMYRVNTRAREGNREFSLYLARRFECGGEYLGCVIALLKANIAKASGDSEAQASELEKAVESLNSGLNALAAVARSDSDRGVIAIINEYGYRPLKKELEAE